MELIIKFTMSLTIKRCVLKVMDIIQFLFFSSHNITHTVLLVQCLGSSLDCKLREPGIALAW